MVTSDNDRQNIHISIIDSGIDVSKLALNCYVATSFNYWIDEKGHVDFKCAANCSNDHGTIIAIAIRHIHESVRFNSHNILDKDLKSDGRILISALKHAIEENPDIIHMSLGTSKLKYYLPLKILIRRACKKGIIIVSAASNTGKISFPSNFKDVVSVKGDGDINCNQYDFREGYFIASNNVMDIPNIKYIDNYENYRGTSMAAAYITGQIAKIKSERGGEARNIGVLLKRKINI
ncbi:S8 family serine peptidase [Paenibacillus sp. 22594]|uniref:S8 family serine peptidase n=1 Tax=Paenibacillus sp. 22594 TaxID=3453947 RepID=UPI003F82DF56